DEALEKLEDYYSDAMDKIESKLEFYEVRNVFEHGHSPTDSIAMASDEYNEMVSLLDELIEIYNNLKAIG
ncbi:MAG: hypothetical protein NC110_07810, partial [Ruminococcus sp.]|nr:hypothetical protein [Ruminococcus sp.]